MSLATLKNRIKRRTNTGKYVPAIISTDIIAEYFLHSEISYQVAALQFLEVTKDLLDTFKPYKTLSHIKSDLKYILSGLAITILNTLALATLISFAPLAFAMDLILHPLTSLLEFSSNFIGAINEIVVLSATLLRSLFEIAIAPLFLLRIPLRAAITWHHGWPTFEGNSGLDRTLEQGEAILNTELTPENIEDCKYIIEHLNYKAIKAKALNQTSYLPNFDKLPHVEHTGSLKFQHNYNSEHKLPEQTNAIFLKAKQDLALTESGVDPKPALREYFRLFRYPDDHGEERHAAAINNVAARI